MLPESLLPIDLREGRVFARYLGAADLPWVTRMLDELAASTGLPRAAVVARLGRRQYEEPARARLALRQVLLAQASFAVAARAPPPLVRAALFAEAARAGPDVPREAVLARAARDLGIGATDAEAALYADLPEARRLESFPELDAHEAVQLHNRAVLAGLLACAEEVRIGAAAHLRAVVRWAKLQRLLCRVERTGEGELELAVSGPLSVLRQTRKYGRALARFVPALCSVAGWRLRARCLLRGQRVLFEASARDPIAGQRPPRRFDSRVEECLYRDLLRAAPTWRVEREPEPIEAAGRLVFPDFGVTTDRGGRVLVEVVGFWTAEYLRAKAADLRHAGRADLVLCVDESLALGEDDVGGLPVLRYRRRVDAHALRARIEALTSTDPPRGSRSTARGASPECGDASHGSGRTEGPRCGGRR